LTILSCAPQNWNKAKNAYRSNDLVGAVQFTAYTLREEPGYKDAVDFLSGLFPATYYNMMNKAQSYESLGNYDDAYYIYVKIQNLSDIISTIPEQPILDSNKTIKFPTTNVIKDIERTRSLAAEYHYQNGQKLEKEGLNKEAALSYKNVADFIDNYKDSQKRYNICRNAAVWRVAVIPFDNNSGKRHFGYIGETISQIIISRAMAHPDNLEFLEFISRDRLEELINEKNLNSSNLIDQKSLSEKGKLLGIHAFIFGNIMSIIIEEPPETRKRIEEFRVITKEKSRDKDTVWADVDIFTRRIYVKMNCSFQLVEVATGKILKSDIVTVDDAVTIQFAKLRGDERALSDNSKRLCNQAEEFPPSPENVVDFLLKKAGENIAKDIITTFK
jgi:tetratricopeptide (TPR) repeat protein